MKIINLIIILCIGSILVSNPVKADASFKPELTENRYVLSKSAAIEVVAESDNTTAKKTTEKSLYTKPSQEEKEKTTWEKLLNLFKVKLFPNLPGALLLFAFSAFFSSINFYSEVSEDSRSTIGVYKYLSVWILINYLFALIILFLILPETATLKEINKTLFLSCLLATAIPEISANLRLQLGKSNRALDLYKYKLKISGLISRKVTQANIDKRSQQLISLAMYYSNRMELFRQKLQILMGQSDLSDEEKEGLNALMEFVKSDSEDMTIEQAVSTVLVRFQMIIPKLLNFFHMDVAKFEHSPVFQLMKNLQPLLTVDEARRLVEAGITSHAKFSSLCANSERRKDLADRTGIDVHRITMLYYSSRQEYLNRRVRNISWAAGVILILSINIFLLLNFYADRLGISSWFPQQHSIQTGGLPQYGGEVDDQRGSGQKAAPENIKDRELK